jgi:hypothetical protein
MVMLTNPNRTIEVEPTLGVFRTDKLQPGEIGKSSEYPPESGLKGRKAYAFGTRHDLTQFEVGAAVIVPLNPDDSYTDWECFTVSANPHYSKIGQPSDETREVSFGEFNVRRHGDE